MMIDSVPASELVRLNEAARILGLSVGRTYGLTEEGKLPCVMIAGERFYHSAAIERIAAERKAHPVKAGRRARLVTK